MRYSVYLQKRGQRGGPIVQIYASDVCEALVEALRTLRKNDNDPITPYAQEYGANIVFNPDPNEKEGQIAEIQQRKGAGQGSLLRRLQTAIKRAVDWVR